MDGVLAPWFQNGRAGGRALRAGFDQLFDDRRFAVQPCDIKHRESGIAALLVGILGVDVGAAFDEQFDLVQGEQIGCGRVHQRSAAERIDGVDVRAVVEHQADGVHIAERRDIRQCDGVVFPA